jgi:hypothetical protein
MSTYRYDPEFEQIVNELEMRPVLDSFLDHTEHEFGESPEAWRGAAMIAGTVIALVDKTITLTQQNAEDARDMENKTIAFLTAAMAALLTHPMVQALHPKDTP